MWAATSFSLCDSVGLPCTPKSHFSPSHQAGLAVCSPHAGYPPRVFIFLTITRCFIGGGGILSECPQAQLALETADCPSRVSFLEGFDQRGFIMRKGVSSPFGELTGSGGNPGSVICEIWEILLLLFRNHTLKRSTCEWQPDFSQSCSNGRGKGRLRSQEGCVAHCNPRTESKRNLGWIIRGGGYHQMPAFSEYNPRESLVNLEEELVWPGPGQSVTSSSINSCRYGFSLTPKRQ